MAVFSAQIRELHCVTAAIGSSVSPISAHPWLLEIKIPKLGDLNAVKCETGIENEIYQEFSVNGGTNKESLDFSPKKIETLIEEIKERSKSDPILTDPLTPNYLIIFLFSEKFFYYFICSFFPFKIIIFFF